MKFNMFIDVWRQGCANPPGNIKTAREQESLTDDGRDFGMLLEEDARMNAQSTELVRETTLMQEQPVEPRTPERAEPVRHDEPAPEVREATPREEPQDARATENELPERNVEGEAPPEGPQAEAKEEPAADEAATDEVTVEAGVPVEVVAEVEADAIELLVEAVEITDGEGQGEALEAGTQDVAAQTTESMKAGTVGREVAVGVTAENAVVEKPVEVMVAPQVQDKVQVIEDVRQGKLGAEKVSVEANTAGKTSSEQVEAAVAVENKSVKAQAVEKLEVKPGQDDAAPAEQKAESAEPVERPDTAPQVEAIRAHKTESGKARLSNAKVRISSEAMPEASAAPQLAAYAQVHKGVHTRPGSFVRAEHGDRFQEAVNPAHAIMGARVADSPDSGAMNNSAPKVRIVNETQFVDSILRQAKFTSRPDGSSEIKINLQPAELGSVTVRLTLRNNQLSAQLQVDSAVVREIIEDVMTRVKETLALDGLDLEQFDVGLRDERNEQAERDDDADNSEGEPKAAAKQQRSRAPISRLAGAHYAGAGTIDFVA